jgi:hypothetical protein
VYNYNEEKLQVREVTQNSIKKQLRDLAVDEDFGDPKEYDVKVNRQGKDLETTYMVKAMSKKEFEFKDIETKASELNLDALFTNDDPFIPSDKF